MSENRGRRRTYGERSPEHQDSVAPQPKHFRSESSGGSRHGDSSRFRADSGPSTSRGGGGGGGGDAGVCRNRPPRPPSRERVVKPRSDKDPRVRYEIVHTRPAEIQTKQGVDGRKIQLKANYYKLITKPTWSLHHYDVSFEPEMENRRMRSSLLNDFSEQLGGYLYDGKQLFTTKIYDRQPLVLNGKTKENIAYTITIKKVGKIESVDWQYLQILNLILRRAMQNLSLQQVGRNLYDQASKIELNEYRIQLWPGYETSIRQHERDILLCSELTHKVMRMDNIYDILCRISDQTDNFQEEFRRTVIGLVILTTYNNKTYRIDDIDFSSTPLSEFMYKGKLTSFKTFYKVKHLMDIKDDRQPLLVSHIKDAKLKSTYENDIVILVPELCIATGLTDQMRSNFKLMSTLAQHTRMGPEKRLDRLSAFNRRLRHTPGSQNLLSKWSLGIANELVEIEGRVIEPQKIVFRDNHRTSAGDKANWTQSFRNCRMLTTPSRGLERWAIVCTQRNVRELNSFLDTLSRAANGMGLRISRPREFVIYDDRTSSYVQAIGECCREDPQLILCVVPNNNVERYNAIKKVGCVDRAVPTQVMTIRTMCNQRGLMTICTKVAIQINCKLGYTPWMIELPLSGLMTIGFDIAKSTRDRSKAYCAMIATMDLPSNATYYSNVAECNAHDLLANSLWPMIMKALRQYRLEHKQLPKRIIIYRDGISAGALKQAYEHEVKDIVEKLKEEYKRAEREPMFAYIVVTKALKTRLFLTQQPHGSRGANPPPGTIVDDIITQPEWYDFFLVSQHVNQGTVSPTSYNVLHSSNIRLTPDQIQKLTYKMAHLYYNWSGTTRVPSVVQYAKKLATLVATNIHQIPNNALEKKFYYL